MATMHSLGVRDAPLDQHRPAPGSWHTTAEAARALGVSPSTIRRRIADGRLTARREPYRQSFRWLVLLPASPSLTIVRPRGTDTADACAVDVGRAALAVVRETDEELRAIAAQVDLTRHAVVSVLERERTIALRQAALLDGLAEDPGVETADRPTPHASSDTGRAEGSWRALLIALLVCVAAATGGALLALPAWSGGIVGALAVVGGLIAAVEAYLLVTAWIGGLARRAREST